MKIDKIAHLLAGASIAAILAPLGLTVAVVGTFIAAVGKEIYDKFTHGNPDPVDAASTMAGGTLALLAQWGLVWLLL